MVNEISYADMQQAIDNSAKTGKPIVIDFWAPWCGPCRVLSPIVDEVSEKMSDMMMFAKINIEENGEAALEYGVMSIPTLIVFENGKEVHRIVGSLSEIALVDELADCIVW